jgi:hypothetical protein
MAAGLLPIMRRADERSRILDCILACPDAHKHTRDLIRGVHDDDPLVEPAAARARRWWSAQMPCPEVLGFMQERVSRSAAGAQVCQHARDVPQQGRLPCGAAGRGSRTMHLQQHRDQANTASTACSLRPPGSTPVGCWEPAARCEVKRVRAPTPGGPSRSSDELARSPSAAPAARAADSPASTSKSSSATPAPPAAHCPARTRWQPGSGAWRGWQSRGSRAHPRESRRSGATATALRNARRGASAPGSARHRSAWYATRVGGRPRRPHNT